MLFKYVYFLHLNSKLGTLLLNKICRAQLLCPSFTSNPKLKAHSQLTQNLFTGTDCLFILVIIIGLCNVCPTNFVRYVKKLLNYFYFEIMIIPHIFLILCTLNSVCPSWLCILSFIYCLFFFFFCFAFFLFIKCFPCTVIY